MSPKRFSVIEQDPWEHEETIAYFDSVEEASVYAQNMNNRQSSGYLYTVIEIESND